MAVTAAAARRNDGPRLDARVDDRARRVALLPSEDQPDISARASSEGRLSCRISKAGPIATAGKRTEPSGPRSDTGVDLPVDGSGCDGRTLREIAFWRCDLEQQKRDAAEYVEVTAYFALRIALAFEWE